MKELSLLEKQLKMNVKSMGDKTMKKEYDLSVMKKRPNPFAKQLKQQITIPLRLDVIEYFEVMSQEAGISFQELINLYLQDCVINQRKISLNLDNV